MNELFQNCMTGNHEKYSSNMLNVVLLMSAIRHHSF